MSHKTTEALVKVSGEFIAIPTEDTMGKNPSVKLEVSRYTLIFLKYGGMFMALCSSLFFSCAFIIIKILGDKYSFKPFGSSVLFHFGIFIPCVLVIAIHQWGPGSKGRPKIFQEIWPLSEPEKRTTFGLLLIQASLQSASVIFRSYSLQYLAIGDMTVIVFSSPVVTTVIAHFLVGEPIGLFFIFTAIFTLAGVALVTKPPILTGAESFDDNTMIGSCFAAGALLSLSFIFAFTRKIKNTHFLLMVFFLGTVGVLVSTTFFLVFEDPATILPKDLTEGLLVFGLFTAFLALASIMTALKLEDAGPIALIRSCDVIFAFVLQFLFLDVVPDLLSTIGAAIVVGGVVMTGFRKWLMILPPDAKQRKYFAYCLK